MEGVKEYADEPVVYQRPDNMGQLLQSKAIKDRLQVLNYLVYEIAAGNQQIVLEVTEFALVLAKEQNYAALSKALYVIEIMLQLKAINGISILALILEHAASIKQQVKNSVQFIVACAAEEDFNAATATMQRFASNKQVKLVVEISSLLCHVLSQYQPNIQLLNTALPFLEHQTGDVRKPVVDLVVWLGYSLGKNAILQFLKYHSVSEQIISTFENQLAADVADKSDYSSAISGGKYDYDEFDTAPPAKFVLGKAFEDKMKNPNWKERKSALEEAIDALKAYYRVESFDMSKIIINTRLLLEEEKTVYVVQLSLKLLGLLCIKCGTLGGLRQLSPLLQSVQNRTKEKKYAIVNGYQIFVQSLLVRGYNFGQLQNDLFLIAIPHKNIEVREELLRLIKVCCATQIVYYLKMDDEDNKIAVLSNDCFPSPVFPNTEEPLPLNGEKSLGMYLNSRAERYRCASNLVFTQFFVGGEPNCENVHFPTEVYNSFFENLEKTLNDTNASIRDLSYRAAALFIAANVFEGSDAICRSGENPLILAAYNQMYYYLVHAVVQSRRRSEIQTLIAEISKFTGVYDPFSGFFDATGYSQVAQTQQQAVRPAGKQIAMYAAKSEARPSEQRALGKQYKLPYQMQYDYRMAAGVHIVVDANNSKAPVTIQMLDEMYTYLGLCTASPEKFFMKDVLKTSFGSYGNFKWLCDNIGQLLAQDMSYYRDIILLYFSLILADGFLVKSQVSPAHIKFFYESFSCVVQALQKQHIYLNRYDLECILPAILQKLEQQSTATAKQLLFKAFDQILEISYSLEEVIIICLKTVSKQSKIYIRYITTKVAILRLIAGLCVEFSRYNMRFYQLTPLHLSGLYQFYLNKQAENYVLTDSDITRLIPAGICTQKYLTIYIISVTVQCTSADMQQKILLSCQKFMQEGDLQASYSLFQQGLYQQVQEPAVRRQVYYSAAQTAFYQAPLAVAYTSVAAPFYGFRQQPAQTASIHQPSALQQICVYERQPPAQIAQSSIVYQPFYVQKTPVYNHKRLSNTDVLNFPDTLVEVPQYPSPLPSRQFYQVLETPNLQDIMQSQENQKYAQLCDLPLNGDCAEQVVRLLKHFVRSLRQEQSTMYLESQVEHLSLRVAEFLQYFCTPQLLAEGPTDVFFLITKYAILALAQLSQAELFHYTHVYKRVFGALLPACALFATAQARSNSYTQCQLVVGAAQGFALQLAEISDIFRLAAVLLQLISYLAGGQADGRVLQLIAQNKGTENYHFVYCFILGLLQRIYAYLVRDLQQEIDKRAKIAADLTNCENPLPLEPQLRPELIQYWNGADYFMFYLHLVYLHGKFSLVDEITRGLGENAVFIMGKVPEQSELRSKLGW